MQTGNNAILNTNDSEPTTAHDSIYSGSSSKTLATSVESLVPTKTLFDTEYLTLTSSKLQNFQCKPENFAQGKEMPTKCLICGNPTSCYHYGVPSCNGCKAFFRRALLESRTYACKLNNGMCRIIRGTNRCRACRFDRCILVGMNPRSMQFPASIDMKKLSDKVSNRRRFLLQKFGGKCPVAIRKTGPVFEETIENKIIQSLVYVELKVRKIRESSRCLSESVIFRSIRELLESNHENVLAHADQYPKELKWPLTLNELKLSASEKRPKWLILDMFLCIEMARTMPVFSQLDYNDQESLLKQVIFANMVLLMAFYSCEMKSETFIMPNGCLPAVLLKDHRLNGIMERANLISCRTMVAISRIQMTMEEFVLLKAIIYSHSVRTLLEIFYTILSTYHYLKYFLTAIHGLSDRGRVLLERESIRHSKTLMKHLQSQMGAAPGAKKYAELISFVGTLFYAAQQIRQIHVYTDPVFEETFEDKIIQSLVYVELKVRKKTVKVLVGRANPLYLEVFENY